jgi:putative endonuclease
LRSTPTVQTGKCAEDLAVDFLSKAGFKIIARNFRTRNGELDIVAEEKGTLVFVEVKARRHAYFGSPFESVTRTKQKLIIRTALAFLQQYKPRCTQMRFDVLAIALEQPPVFDLLRNAFEQ